MEKDNLMIFVVLRYGCYRNGEVCIFHIIVLTFKFLVLPGEYLVEVEQLF